MSSDDPLVLVFRVAIATDVQHCAQSFPYCQGSSLPTQFPLLPPFLVSIKEIDQAVVIVVGAHAFSIPGIIPEHFQFLWRTSDSVCSQAPQKRTGKMQSVAYPVSTED